MLDELLNKMKVLIEQSKNFEKESEKYIDLSDLENIEKESNGNELLGE